MGIRKLSKIVESPEVNLATIITDALLDVPMGRFFVSLYKVGINISDYLLCKKFAHFLMPMSGMEDTVDEFLSGMTDDMRKELAEYLFSLLSKAESADKSMLMGFVFKATVLRNIDFDMMLRLVSIIGRAFISDFHELPNYLENNDYVTIAANEFINLGLIDNDTGGYWKDSPAIKLNEVGYKLYEILNNEKWFCSSGR